MQSSPALPFPGSRPMPSKEPAMQSAGVTPRQLPARQFISLDALVTRAKYSPPRRSTPATPTPRPAPRTLADIERASSIAVAPPARPPTPPSALALWITIATCTCGRVHRWPSTSVLIKYAENEHSFHYARDDAALATLPSDLPRELREKPIRIPYCEECFK